MSLLARRALAVASLVAASSPFFLLSPSARAQSGALPPLPSSSVSAGASASASAAIAPSASASTPTAPPTPTAPQPVDADAWQTRYDAAGRRMTAGDFLGAIQEYSALAANAPSETARNLALEQLRIASEYASRNGKPPPSPSGNGGNAPPPSTGAPPPPTPDPIPWTPKPVDKTKRTVDELGFLYALTPAYGFTTGFWIDSLITANDGYRDTATLGAFFIGLGATGLSALSVALLDNAKVFKYGMPQAIFTGFTVGFGTGMSMALWAGNRSESSFSTYRKFTTFVWGFSTAGTIAGVALASAIPTTPGRAGWVGTTALVSGLTIGGIAAAATNQEVGSNNDQVARSFGLTAAIAGVSGVGIGILTAPLLSPSISRVRFIDLGWLSGGALGLGFCAAYGNGGRGCSERATFGAMSAGAGLGFVAGLIATFAMKPETLSSEKQSSLLDRMVPTVAPTEGGGFSVGVAGAL